MKKNKRNQEKEICSCGKYEVEEGHMQCTRCLDEADEEKRRLERGL